MVIERLEGFVTRLPLAEALARLAAHSAAYNAHYPLAVEYNLVGVATIDDLDGEGLRNGRLRLVEGLSHDFPD